MKNASVEMMQEWPITLAGLFVPLAVELPLILVTRLVLGPTGNGFTRLGALSSIA